MMGLGFSHRVYCSDYGRLRELLRLVVGRDFGYLTMELIIYLMYGRQV